MTVQTALAIALVVGFGAAQYILAYGAMRDLARRPRVRGNNKVAWALLILCVPVAGALIYGWMGPTSLLRRPRASVERVPARRAPRYTGRASARRNITPITDARRRPTDDALSTPAGERRATRDITRTGS